MGKMITASPAIAFAVEEASDRGDKDDHAYSENGGRDEYQAHDHVVCSGDERIHGGEHMV